MLVDDARLAWKDDRWVIAGDLAELTVPQEISSFLAARLEQLPDRERALLVCASVEGAIFHANALQELMPELSDSTRHAVLDSLVRRDVIRPDRTSFPGDESYRFRHILIRDAAYWSLAKATRADLHERFADWLEGTAGPRIREFEEIVGYHLEQAYSCRVGLRRVEDITALGTRASGRLEAAGQRALARSDLPAAIGLLERAGKLLPVDEGKRPVLLAELGGAMIEAGRLSDAEAVLAEARRLAAAADDECADAHALVQQQFLQLLRVADGGMEEAARAVETVVPVFAECGDEHGLCNARRLEAWLHWNEAHAAAAADAWERAAIHASLAGDEHARVEILTWIASALWFGPTPVAEGIRRCEQIHRDVSGHIESEALTLRHLGGLHAMNGNVELARTLLDDSNAVFADLGPTLANAATSHIEAVADMLAATPRPRRRAFERRSTRSSGWASRHSCRQPSRSSPGRCSRRNATPKRRSLRSSARSSRRPVTRSPRFSGEGSKRPSSRGEAVSKKPSGSRARPCLSRSGPTSSFSGATRGSTSHAFSVCGRPEEASAAAARGLHLHEQKRNVVAAARIHSDPPAVSSGAATEPRGSKGW